MIHDEIEVEPMPEGYEPSLSGSLPFVHSWNYEESTWRWSDERKTIHMITSDSHSVIYQTEPGTIPTDTATSDPYGKYNEASMLGVSFEQPKDKHRARVIHYLRGILESEGITS